MTAALRIWGVLGAVLALAGSGAWGPVLAGAGLIICQGPSWQIERGEGWATYACTVPCPGPWSTCTHSAPDAKGANRHALTTLAFTSDGIGGELRWNGPLFDAYTAGLATHPGGNGHTYIEDRAKAMRGLRSDLERQGLLVIDIRWEKGARAKVGAGWFSRSSPQGVSVQEITRRPALVLEWARDNLVPAGKRFGTLGCSAGSLATYAAVAWHGLDSKIDYQLISGGPPVVWDVGAFCTGQVAEGEPKGICENDPARACASDGQCGAGVKCAHPWPPARNARARLDVSGLRSLVDYVLDSPNICSAGKSIPAFETSSLRTTAGVTRVDHPVDFILDTSGGRLSSPIGLIITNDTDGTITYTAGRTYSSLSTTDPAGKTWNTYPGAHCSWMADSAYLKNTVYGMILRGLKLEPPKAGQ